MGGPESQIGRQSLFSLLISAMSAWALCGGRMAVAASRGPLNLPDQSPARKRKKERERGREEGKGKGRKEGGGKKGTKLFPKAPRQVP